MARVFKKYKLDGTPYPEYHMGYINRFGVEVRRKGTTSKTVTLNQAREFQMREKGIADGTLEAPKPIQAIKPICKIVEEYFTNGLTSGGRNGFPWSPATASKKKSDLKFWIKKLSLKTPNDLDNSLPKVEAVIREFQESGLSGKTILNRLDAVITFTRWMMKRKYYLGEFPFEHLCTPNSTPLKEFRRRLITLEEFYKLLAVSTWDQQILFKTAFYSGLRAKELRELEVSNLDVENGGLHLSAEWTKNRTEDFQVLPMDLVHELKKYADSGRAKKTYLIKHRKHYTKWAEQRPPSPLLYVPMDTAQSIDSLFRDAGIEKYIEGQGKLDFHSLRVAFATYCVASSGGNLKEAQALCRHSTPELTMNVYGRVRNDVKREIVERMAEATSSPPPGTVKG